MSGLRWVAHGAAEFPPRLAQVEPALRGLWVKSTSPAEALAALFGLPAVALVGARAASPAGRELARQLAWAVGRAGGLVVSGLARGIDGAAHEGALLAGGKTLAVLGCGLARCYPEEHAALAARVAAAGALVSEWPPETPVRGWHFPRRNRLISGLADLVVVVEGTARSGARHTVDFALAQGREVRAVPRDPLLGGSVLPNRLLRDGAAPVVDGTELVAALGLGRVEVPDGRRMRRCDTAPGHAATPRVGWARVPAEGAGAQGPLRACILRQLGRGGGQSAARLAQHVAHRGAGALQAELLSLEVEGRVRRDRAGMLHLAGEA